MDLPSKVCELIRHHVREILLEKLSGPTVDSVLLKLQNARVEDIEHLDLFENPGISEADSLVLTYCRPTSYRFMKVIGFICEEIVTHYEHTKSRADIVSMRDD